MQTLGELFKRLANVVFLTEWQVLGVGRDFLAGFGVKFGQNGVVELEL
jgi:hypothetical protein